MTDSVSNRDIASARQSADKLGLLLESQREALRGTVRAYLPKRHKSFDDSSDLLQQTLTAAFEAWPNFRGETPIELLAWLRTIARRTTKHAVLKAAKRPVPVSYLRSEAESSRELWHAATSAEPVDALVVEEDLEELRRCLGQLTDADQLILMLRHFDGFKFESIAEVLGKTPSASRMMYLRALDRLRAMFRH